MGQIKSNIKIIKSKEINNIKIRNGKKNKTKQKIKKTGIKGDKFSVIKVKYTFTK